MPGSGGTSQPNTNRSAFPNTAELSCSMQCSAAHARGLAPGVGEVRSDGDVVHPRLQLGVEELQPLFSNVKDEGTTQEKVFQPETGSHSPEIKQIPLKGEAERGTR